MKDERLNQFCAIDLSAFTLFAELKPLLLAMGSFSGWWLEDWPVGFENACREHFKLDDVSSKALREMLRPKESGFRLVRRPGKTVGLDQWEDLRRLRDASTLPFDVVIGEGVPFARCLSAKSDEHFEIIKQSPRQLYLPSGADSFIESVSVLTIKGGPTWIVDPHLALWVENSEQDMKFNILKTLADKLQRNESSDELILITTWKPEHRKENSKWGVPDPHDTQIKKFLIDRLKSLIKRDGYSIRVFLDRGAEYAEFDTHKRYLFNAHGGIEFEYGLADRSLRKSKPKSYFGFVGEALHRQLRDVYSRCNVRSSSRRFELLANIS